MTKDRTNRYITRVDYRYTHGWWVRVADGSSKAKSKLFSDKINGGTVKALALARQWRDEKEQLIYGRAGSPGMRGGYSRHRRNTTGIVGVTYFQRNRWNGASGPYSQEGFSVKWTDANGTHHHTAYSIKKYGKRKAFQLAKQKREAMLQAKLQQRAAKLIGDRTATY